MDNKYPKVSVLIPVYNAQNFIERTIKSALNQSFRDLEVIVLDDGSKDKTGDIVCMMQKHDPRISYFYQENQGLPNTRNRLAELAKGELVAFLDHDDEWLPEKTQKQLRLFEDDKTIGLVFSDSYISKDDKIIGTCFKERKPSRGRIFYKYLFSANFIPLITVMLPRKILVEYLPFNSNYEISEEFDMFLKIVRNCKCDYVDQPLAIYHRHQTNATITKCHKKWLEDDFAILDYWVRSDPDIKRLYTRELNNRLSQLYYYKGVYYLGKKNASGVIESIFNSFKHKLVNILAIKLTIKLIFDTLGIKYRHND